MTADFAWVAAVEELAPDARGTRRVLRLHAVRRDDAGGVERHASCGYRYRPDELRPARDWATVTASGRCPLCDSHHPSDDGADVVDVRDVRDVRDLRDENRSRQRSDR